MLACDGVVIRVYGGAGCITFGVRRGMKLSYRPLLPPCVRGHAASHYDRHRLDDFRAGGDTIS